MAAHRIDVHHHYATAELVDELTRVGIHDVGGQPLKPQLATPDRPCAPTQGERLTWGDDHDDPAGRTPPETPPSGLLLF
jgi:hypothetical protein